MPTDEAPVRKRSRPSLRDVDELAIETASAPVSSVKKPKLDTPEPPPTAAPGSSFLARKFDRWFGSGEAGNKTGDGQAVSFINRATAGNAAPKTTTKRTYTKKQSARRSASMGPTVEPTEEEDAAQQKKQKPLSKRAMLHQAKSLARQAARERLEAAAENAHDETTVGTNGRPSGVRKSTMVDTKGNLTPVKRKRGRPRKNVAFESPANADGEVLGFKDLPTSAKDAQKGNHGRPRTTGASKEIKANLEKSVYDFTSSESEGGIHVTPRRSTGAPKDTKLPKRSSNGSGEPNEQEQIARPTPNRAVGRPKSTPHPQKAVLVKHSKTSSDAEVSMDSDECEDDEVCEVCGDAESEEPNLIIFCEACPLAVHQECYNIPVVPEGDWFCKNCRPEANDSHILPVLSNLEDGNETPELVNNLPDIDGSEQYLAIMQRLVLSKLTGQKRIKLRGHDEDISKVHQLVEQTVLAGEGNSMLVIGARGSGKTTLVESVITDLSLENRESFHVIRLNGFVHTDDKLALREIWRQLGREMEVEDDVAGKPANHADTLASLLALLSHPSEISEDQGDQTAKSVIFILDEFDLFTTHPRQTLLYNLFDIAQAKKAPIAVLGLTSRVDVVEALEKRVKSRFSHRYVHLSLPRSLPAFWDICKDGLIVDHKEFNSETNTEFDNQDEFMSCWESMIEGLYNNDATFKQQLQAHFYRTKSAPAFFTSCILPVASLSPKNFPLTGRSFVSSAPSLSAPDSKLHILQGLSDLELALLISAARLDIILDTDTCNFAMAYDEYSTLTSRHKIQTSSTGVTALGASAKVWGREVALSAWERLAEYDLLVPATIGGGARDVGVGGRMWKVDIGLEEISGSVDGLSSVMAKWCREI
ncbi:origin recognition complex subunit [Phlyctema vagabunda]|uniref:Origin recognition complex subunit 4 n=1 Tax=Phlyctema vagabunda TaxID=108571 RepID=A0ABR4PYD4_9HELO